MEPKDVVLAYWEAMRTNDFAKAAEWFTADIVIDWAQSRERIHGRKNFAALNHAYPAAGRWTFTMNRIVAEGAEVVTDMTISDGAVVARALTFHSVRDGLIARQTELWADDYPAPDWRAAWVERY
jgi:limonene-1,2-epoxide hydrolase